MTSRRLVLAFCLLVVCSSLNARAAEVFDGIRVAKYPRFVAQPWFPLVAGMRYWYSGTFNGKVDEAAITVVRHDTPFGPLYYFAQEAEIDDPSPLLFTNMFGLAGYTTTSNQVLTIQATYFHGFREEVSAHVQTLLRLPLVSGDVTEFRMRGKPVRLTVAGSETITVPAGTFDCMRIDLMSEDPAGNTSTVWLAKDVGLVKWRRQTGRVDVLTRFELPRSRR